MTDTLDFPSLPLSVQRRTNYFEFVDLLTSCRSVNCLCDGIQPKFYVEHFAIEEFGYIVLDSDGKSLILSQSDHHSCAIVANTVELKVTLTSSKVDRMWKFIQQTDFVCSNLEVGQAYVPAALSFLIESLMVKRLSMKTMTLKSLCDFLAFQNLQQLDLENHDLADEDVGVLTVPSISLNCCLLSTRAINNLLKQWFESKRHLSLFKMKEIHFQPREQIDEIFQSLPYSVVWTPCDHNHSRFSERIQLKTLPFMQEMEPISIYTLWKSKSLDTGSTPPRHAWSHFGKKWNIFRTYGWPKKSGVLKIRVIFCFCLLIVGRLVNVALPLYSKWIVNSLSDPEGFDYSLIYAMILLRLLHGGGNMNGFINTLRTYLWIPIRQYTFRELDVTLFNHLHSLPMQWHTSRQIGLVLKAANRGTNCVDDILNLFLFSMLPTLADFAIAVVFFASNFNIYFGVVVFVTMATHLALNIFITEWRTKFRRDMNDRENMMGAIGTDSLLNYETVKYYGNEDYEVKRYRTSIESFQEAEWLNLATMAFQNFLLHGILAIGLFSGSMLAVWMITKHSLTVGDYVLFTSYIVQLYSPLNAFGHHYRMVQKSLIDMENMLSLFDVEPETDPAPDAAPFVHKGGSITADKLVFAYNDNQNILNDVSFKVANGQTVALVGLSGSGKTSIIRLLYRLYDFCVGSLKIDGVDIRRVQAKSLRKQIGIVPQETALFNETIRFNIRYGDLDATDLEVEEAAKAAMIHDKIISLPLGYDTVVGDRGTKLSGGEKQRLAIARTILKKPNFIFLDEATSALDIHTERAIQGCLEKLCKDRTSLVVAHRLSTIVGADCILVMDKGVIVERGTHEELLAMEGVYHHMWQTQHTKHSSTSSLPSDEDEE